MNDNKWKRKLPGRIYDYNYQVSEGYYKPQTEYLEKLNILGDKASIPTAMTYAERFASCPWYGKTRGLPYDSSLSALNEPLLKPSEMAQTRASSIIREMKENEGVPPSVRASRRRKRQEEEDELLNIRRKPERRVLYDMETPSLPPKRSSFRDDIRKLDDEIGKILDKPKPGKSSRNYEYSTATSVGGNPGRKTIKHEESSYSLPSSRSRFRRSSHTEVTTASSISKPPLVPRARRVNNTYEEDSNFKLPPRPRTHRDSIGEQAASAYHTRSYRSPSITSDNDDILSFSKSKEIRDARRAKESEDLTENIHKMVDRMRIRDIDPELAYKYSRDIRASSLDPYENDTRYRSRRRARANNFVYGVGH